MGAKAKYRIRNWKDYNKSLIQRGSITVWFSEDAIDKWHSAPTGKRGRSTTYSDEAILTALLIRFVFHLPLRALEGFLSSLVSVMGLCLFTPSYSQICRRAQLLGKDMKRLTKRTITDLVIDSSGLKVYGEGEWKVRQHGVGKRRTWRKLHLAICPDTNEILFVKLTDNKTSDHKVYPQFLRRTPKTVKRTYGDGAYDRAECYRANYHHGSRPVIPPQRNARYRADAPNHLQERNHAILEIRGLGGDDEARRLWKMLKGYHLRSLAETGMYRFKTLFGEKMRSRIFRNQQAEVYVKSVALNMMTRQGMPKSERKAA
jgi:Transposase DDE domain